MKSRNLKNAQVTIKLSAKQAKVLRAAAESHGEPLARYIARVACCYAINTNREAAEANAE